MTNYPKAIKRHIRDLAALAYERELDKALLSLAEQINAWRQRQLSAGELSDQIHRFDTGIARELYTRYHDGYVELQVAYAIVTGLIQETEVPRDVWPYLQTALQFYRDLGPGSDMESTGHTQSSNDGRGGQEGSTC